MSNFNEKSMYEIVNKIDEEKIINAIYDINISEESISNKSIHKIKNKTFKKLNLKQPRKHIKFRIPISLTACLAILFLILNTPFMEQVKASANKIIQYVPGFNVIFENKPESYALQKPVELVTGDTQIKVKGATIDSNSAYFYITFETHDLNIMNRNQDKSLALNEYRKIISDAKKNIVIRDAEGIEYGIDSYNASIGKDIVLLLKHYGNIKNPKMIKITFDNVENGSISLNLTKVNGCNSFEELGPTVTNNGLSVTAIVRQDKDKTYFNLVCPTDNNIQIESFGIKEKKIKLVDEAGNEYKTYCEEGGIGCLNELYVNTEDIKGKKLNLIIPNIDIKYVNEITDKKNSIEFNISDSDSYNINKNIQGFPINLKKVKKINNEAVRLYFDLNKDYEKNNSYLKAVSFINESYISKFDDDTGILEYIDLSINASDKIKKLFIGDIVVTKHGDWNIEIIG